MGKKVKHEGSCALCDRILDDTTDEHHLIPKSYKGTEVIKLHRICHDTLHHTFTEYELAKVYNTIEKLQQHETITAFKKWVANKPFNFYNRVRDTNRRNNKR